MAEWLAYLFGWGCGALAVLKAAAGAWLLAELVRKWRATPGLWGIDWLDIGFRLEREFGVALSGTDFAALSAEARAALTAGQLWGSVASRLRAAGRTPPEDGWGRLARALSEALNVPAERVTPAA